MNRYRIFRRACALLVVVIGVIGASIPSAANAAEPRLGINLAGPADWNTELPFVDVFRFSRTWISQRRGEAWGKGPDLKLDENGWVMQLESGCWAETPLCTLPDGHYPSGKYTVLYEGEGTIEFWGAAAVASRDPNRILIDVDSRKGGFFLRLTKTNPNNYVRNIRVLMPGAETTYRENPWNQGFLERWQGIACLRYMDFMETNNSPISTWNERSRLEDATWTRHGVPAEVMIDLANRLQADPWFCMPHKADDEYVRNFAKQVHEKLSPQLKVYVEYSNEVWNSQFSQNRYAGEQGRTLGLADKPWEAAWRYTAMRSIEIFKIWEEVFGGAERLVRVLPSQAANSYIAEQILSFRDAYQHADALAIAPYVSFNVRPDGDLPASQVTEWPVDQLLDHVETRALPDATKWIEQNKQVADKYKLKLIAYEAGQHLVGIQGAENNERLTRLLHEANAHRRMGEIYATYLEAWERQGGDLLCHFSSVGQWSKYGSWGLLQFADDPPEASPKFAAVMQWAKSKGQSVHWPASPSTPSQGR